MKTCLPLPPSNHYYNCTPQLNFAHVPYPRPSPPRFLTAFCNDAHHSYYHIFHPAPPMQSLCRSSRGHAGSRPPPRDRGGGGGAAAAGPERSSLFLLSLPRSPQPFHGIPEQESPGSAFPHKILSPPAAPLPLPLPASGLAEGAAALRAEPEPQPSSGRVAGRWDGAPGTLRPGSAPSPPPALSRSPVPAGTLQP